jgi:MFS family permease
MNIQSVSMNSYQKGASFKSNSQKYENPVNRGTERNLALLASVGGSALVGVVAGGLSTCFAKIKATGWKGPVGIGAVAGLLTLALTLPQKLYATKVNAFAREKEMDVFSRQKSAQTNIYEDINDEIKDEKVSLDQKINHYSTVKMADNGQGMMVKGV